MDTVKENGGRGSQSVALEKCFLCQNKHLLSLFKEQKKTPTKYPNFVEVRIVVIGKFKKKKASLAAKAVQAQLTWKMLLQ